MSAVEMTDAETRNPWDVIRHAREDEEWAIWHPGDGTQYRVKMIKVVGGPDHADWILLVNCTTALVALQFADPETASYRLRKWSHARFTRERKNPFGNYDWWPQVIEPLLFVAGASA